MFFFVLKNCRRWVFSVLVSLLLLAALSPAAQADEHVFAMQCDAPHNRVMVRFGMNGGHYAATPKYLMEQWKDIPISEYSGVLKHSCLFSNGQSVTVSATTSAEVNTSGGGDLTGFFSLFIDSQRIYKDKLYYVGSGISLYQISAVSFSGKDRLLVCDPNQTPMQFGATTSKPSCEEQHLFLDR